MTVYLMVGHWWWCGQVSFSSLSEFISPDSPLCLPVRQAYASGCDVVILGSDFERLQIIPGAKHGNIQVGCVDCSLDGGRVRAPQLMKKTQSTCVWIYVCNLWQHKFNINMGMQMLYFCLGFSCHMHLHSYKEKL